MKSNRLSVLLALATVVCGTLMPTVSEAAQRQPRGRRKPVDLVATNIAAVAADLAKLDQMRKEAQGPQSNVIVLGKATKLSEAPSARVSQAIAHFDLVAAYATNPPMAAAARRGKAAMEAGLLDKANAALAEVQSLKGKK